MGIEENKKFALAFIEAIGRGDAQAIQDAYAEDGSSWTLGSMPISGRFSKAEIAVYILLNVVSERCLNLVKQVVK